ncbi:hypothetical protein HPP92_012841 [Vanilla planifolia]|uniref:Pentatricopeptide repeat-containing protein n=1 Tax=Vanilla planifolia TaxID=51239 RepID=A0A835QMA4_VANPL|nr:hypothetical protein HPP92_012841 [Vanilla planifolia]
MGTTVCCCQRFASGSDQKLNGEKAKVIVNKMRQAVKGDAIDAWKKIEVTGSRNGIVSVRCSQSLLFNVRRRLSSSPSSSSASWSDGHAFDLQSAVLPSRRFDDIESLLEARKTDLPYEASAREAYLSPSLPPMRLPACLITPSARWTSSPPRLPSYCYLTQRPRLRLQPLKAPSSVAFLTCFPTLPPPPLSPDKISYGILIKSLCLARDASKALPLFREMEEKKIEITKVSYTTILDSLYKEGKPEEAERIWREMCSKGVAPDVVAYNVKCMYWSKSGKSEDVLRLMEEMKDAGLDPDTITYNYLMSCYCKYGRFEDAKRVYRELGEKCCEPNSATFKNLLYALCKNDDFEGGLEVFNDSVAQEAAGS